MRRAIAALLATVALGLAACGVQPSGAPTTLSPSVLPQALIQQQPPNGGEGPQPRGKQVPIKVYLLYIVTAALVAVTREVPGPVTVQKVLKALEVGPYAVNYQAGEGTAVATESNLQSLGIANDVARVRLDSYFVSLQGYAPVQELAQIVWSVTQSVPGIRKVRFFGPNGSIAVETGTGQFVHHAVTQCDYQLGLIVAGCAG